jgi:hypothetical protein
MTVARLLRERRSRGRRAWLVGPVWQWGAGDALAALSVWSERAAGPALGGGSACGSRPRRGCGVLGSGAEGVSWAGAGVERAGPREKEKGPAWA